MTTAGTGVCLPTDDQLGDILRFVARTCLEVERGMRPPGCLQPLMRPAERWLEPGQLGRFRDGPVQDGHIGRPQISRLTDTHIVATVVTRTEADRWGALSLELRSRHGRWRICTWATSASSAIPSTSGLVGMRGKDAGLSGM